MKEKLEIIFNQDKTMFLNFWDWAHGNDICVRIENKKLLLSQYDEAGEALPDKEISFLDYLDLVKASIDKRTV